MSKLDPEFKAAWCEALRSGKYKQSRNGLRDDSGFCCLGVLCNVADPNGWEQQADKYRFKNAGLAYLPEGLMIAAGLDSKTMFRLADLNDIDGASFPEIADYIEANL